MREFAILVQFILLRPANADAAPAIGLIAPGADLHGHISSPGAAAWISQHLAGGLALVLPLMTALMLHALARKLSGSCIPALSGRRVPVPPVRNHLAPDLARAVKEERAASAPAI